MNRPSPGSPSPTAPSPTSRGARLTAALIVLAALLCASCSLPVKGVPTPNYLPTLPTRPRVLRIDGIDPCSTLTPDQVVALDVRDARGRTQGLDKQGPGCDWARNVTEPFHAYTVDINTEGGVELAFGASKVDVVTVAGFGAIATPGVVGTGEGICVINVDVAPGQAVQVAYFSMASKTQASHELACRYARNAAEMAMQTIIHRLGR